jgi:glycosyltransferase involved in cell wall biosynthesis
MKILTVNRNYFVTGGPEKYMFSLAENMTWHRFIPFCVDFERNRQTPYRGYFVSAPAGADEVYYKDYRMSPLQKAMYAVDSIYNVEARRKLERLIRDTRPDLALFLNAVHFSDSIIDACRAHGVPIVWRMSDFHKVCPSYLLYRDGRVCEDCLEKGLRMALRNRCGGYQRSLAAAAVKVAGMWLSRLRRLHDKVECFITPSAFTRKKMIEGGYDPEKIVCIPTFVEDPGPCDRKAASGQEILYVGRLSHEKGVETLVQAFQELDREDVRLSIVGDDSTPYALQLKERIPPRYRDRIGFHGFLEREEIWRHFDRATCLVIPSVCYENQPNAVLEGMARGCPPVVSRLGSLVEMVRHGKTGLHFEPGNAQGLRDALAFLLDHEKEAWDIGNCAREHVLRHHSMERHLHSLDTLFLRCVNDSIGT